MVLLTKQEQMIMGRASKRFGYTALDRSGGRTYEEALLTNPYAGIYQRRHKQGKVIIVKEKFYVPTNPQTIGQQLWRAVFTAGVIAYHLLSPTQIEEYKNKGKKRRITAYNQFMSDYLKSHLI